MRIPKWEKFQHYKHRKPPWIRLYRELLEDPAWVHQSDAAKALLCELWMVASDTQDGSLPAIEALAWRLRRSEADIRLALAAISPKFLDGASGALAGCKQDATSEERRVTEQRRGEGERPRETILEAACRIHPPEPPMPNPTPVPEWEAQAKSIWSNHLGGENDYVYADLIAVVRRFGAAKTLIAWEAYCLAKSKEQGGKFASARSFAQKPGPWMEKEPEKVVYASEILRKARLG